MYTNDRHAYRQAYFDVWAKYQNHELLTPLESQLLNIMISHPEYHVMLAEPHTSIQQEYSINDNPFFHMSMHLAIDDQVQTNRPYGMTALYQTLIAKYQDQHIVQHLIMQCLTEMMSQAQRTGTPASDQDYLNALKNI